MSKRSESKLWITADVVREVLDYVPETGSFKWKISRMSHIRAGKVAGRWCRRRHRIGLYGFIWEAPILAYLIMEGVWPEGQMDHKDRDPTNNKWDNLRLVSSAKNCMNQTVRSHNKCGHKGVTKHPDCSSWVVRISAEGRRYHLGLYPTAELAAGAYRIAAAAMHAEFSGI